MSPVTTEAPARPSEAPFGVSALLLEMSPLLVITVCLAIKLIHLSFALSFPDTPAHRQVWSATLGSLILLVAPSLLLPHAWRFVLLLAVDFGLSILMVGDLLHLYFFRDVLSIAEIPEAGQLHMGIASIAATLRPSYALLFLDILILGLLLPVYLRGRRRLPSLRFRPRAALCGLLATGGVLVGLPAALLVWIARKSFSLPSGADRSSRRLVCSPTTCSTRPCTSATRFPAASA